MIKHNSRFFLIVLLLMTVGGDFVSGQLVKQGTNTQAVDGEQHAPSDSNRNDSTLKRRGWRYTVHPSDVLQLTFPLTPEFNQSVIVQPDGYISLVNVGELLATGQTLPQLAESLKKAYAQILRSPVVYVDAKDFEKPYFVVSGEVDKPGKFDWRGEVTVTQAVAFAGGFKDSSKHSQVVLYRRVSNEWTEAKLINVKKMMNSKDLREDPELEPGDMLYVPKNVISKVKPFIPITGLYYNPSQF